MHCKYNIKYIMKYYTGLRLEQVIWDGRACCMHRKEEECIQGFGAGI
jgi:hypothetical protein